MAGADGGGPAASRHARPHPLRLPGATLPAPTPTACPLALPLSGKSPTQHNASRCIVGYIQQGLCEREIGLCKLAVVTLTASKLECALQHSETVVG